MWVLQINKKRILLLEAVGEEFNFPQTQKVFRGSVPSGLSRGVTVLVTDLVFVCECVSVCVCACVCACVSLAGGWLHTETIQPLLRSTPRETWGP